MVHVWYKFEQSFTETQTANIQSVILLTGWDMHVMGRFTYLSLKNRSSCCNSVTASKDKSRSHFSGVLGGGFFDDSEAKLGLIPADRRKKFKVPFLTENYQTPLLLAVWSLFLFFCLTREGSCNSHECIICK